MSYKRSKYFLTSNKRKIKYLFLNKKSQITVVFFHGFMSDMIGEKPNAIQKFCMKNKILCGIPRVRIWFWHIFFKKLEKILN